MPLTINDALKYAESAFYEDDFAVADTYVNAILRAQAKHAHANYLKGKLMIVSGEPKTALEFFKTALRESPKNYDYWKTYVSSLVKSTKEVDTLNILTNATKCGFNKNQIDELKSILRGVNTKFSQSQYYENAVQLREAGQYVKAINLLKNIHDKFPNDPTLLALSAHCHLLADQLDDAESYIDQAKTIDPDAAIVGWNEARLLLKKQKNVEALALSKTLNKRYPDDMEGLVILAASLRVNGEFKASLDILNFVLQTLPQSAEARINIALIYISQKQKTEALRELEISHKLKPHMEQIWELIVLLKLEEKQYQGAINNLLEFIKINPTKKRNLELLSICIEQSNNTELAIESYQKVLNLIPDDAVLLLNLGVAFKRQGDFSSAIRNFSQAAALQPDNPVIHNYLGDALHKEKKFAAAIEAYLKAIKLQPDYATAHNNLGNALLEMEKLDDALEAYENAISINPGYIEAYCNGAEVLEKWNKIEQLDNWLQNAENTLSPIPADVKLMRSKFHWRQKNYKQALDIITHTAEKDISRFSKQDFFKLKGQCLERFGNYEAAFQSFSDMNAIARETREYKEYKPQKYFESLQKDLQSLRVYTPSLSIQPDQDAFNPTFLIGFPRSGTTLLDTVLRSHSKVDVIEEQPMLQSVKMLLKTKGYSEFTKTNLATNHIQDARKHYEDLVTSYSGKETIGHLHVDKLPLNILEVPLIKKIYPNAKFILAVRHPMDAVLSCWMQNFVLNPAMANMTDIDQTVAFYDITMGIFEQCQKTYDLAVHIVKYESLVSSFQDEISAVLKFLDLEWENEVYNYQSTALNRGRIKTPSYSQVIQPLYNDSIYRWKKYESFLESRIPNLLHWIEKFEYSS